MMTPMKNPTITVMKTTLIPIQMRRKMTKNIMMITTKNQIMMKKSKMKMMKILMMTKKRKRV